MLLRRSALGSLGILTSALAACAAPALYVTRPISDGARADVNQRVANRSATVVYDGESSGSDTRVVTEKVTDLRLEREWLVAKASAQASTKEIPEAVLRHITYADHSSGAVRGAIAGGLGGGAAGALLVGLFAVAMCNASNHRDFGVSQDDCGAAFAKGAGFGALVVGVPAMVIGAAIAGGLGTPTHIYFVEGRPAQAGRIPEEKREASRR